MALMTVPQRKKDILQQLRDEKIKSIVLFGEPGVGKTWTARAMSKLARHECLTNIVLWIYLNRMYDLDTLRVCIAQQLSLLPTPGEWEVKDSYEEAEKEKEKEVKLEELTKNILSAVSEQKLPLLIVLDDEGIKMNEQEIRPLLDSLLGLNEQNHKLLITSRNEPKVTDTVGRWKFKVEPMSKEESLSLLKERALIDGGSEDIDALAKAFVGRTKYMPNAIILMAKAFKYFRKNDGGVQLKSSLEEASDSKIYNIMDLLRIGYDLLPNSILIDCQRGDKDEHFFTNSRCINHNELIAYWMMEGYLGHVNCMEKAYKKGHQILMELIDFQVLKRVGVDYITINPLEEELDDFLLERAIGCYRRGYCGNASLGLASVFDDVKWEGLVRITHKGGVMRTLPGLVRITHKDGVIWSIPGGKQGQKVSSLLLDGNALKKGLPSKFITSLEELQVLAIFNPTLDTLSPFSSIIHKLHVFVLRSCRFMENIDKVSCIEKFENLAVLEISGPSSLTEIPDEVFKRASKLQSLNLSSLPIASLPPSLYKLTELRWLILRDCSDLKRLNSLRNFKKLMVLDCSGSTSLHDLQDRSFLNQELQMIDFTETNIKFLPLISGLVKLTHLLLHGCRALNRLRSISSVTSLEVLNLSNAHKFNELYDKSLESLVKLKILDLSGTAVSELPYNVSNPRHLYFKGCSELKVSETWQCIGKLKDLEVFELSEAEIQTLPPLSHLSNLRQLAVTQCLKLQEVPGLSSLEKLEVLDLSGCKALHSIQDKSFNRMCRLHKLDLSETSIEGLPSMSKLSNLRHLLLKNCTRLRKLPPIEPQSLLKLEELYMSGCNSLENIEAHFFEHMDNLQILDLSETLLEELPSLSNLTNLLELHLRGCKGLTSVPNLEALTKLEILDLSGLLVSHLPSLEKLSSLRHLLLNDCSGLKDFPQGKILDVLGAIVKPLPYGISELTCLERLDLPYVKDIHGADSQKIRPLEEESGGCDWGISNLSAEVVSNQKRPPLIVSSIKFLQLLEKDPSLWDSGFKNFHLSVCPIKELDEKSVQRFQGDDFVFRDIYFQTRHYNEFKEQRLLEIAGFNYFPKDINEILSHANNFFFSDNTFKTWPSDFYQMKGCWVEKCGEMENFQTEEMEKISVLLSEVELLWVSNAMNLKSIFNEFLQNEVFRNLKQLYLDCCPNLSTVLSLSQLPGNLKILEIKFCDNLGTIFTQTSQETELRSLEILHLWELPNLESIGCELPTLQSLKISDCPKLRKLEETIKLAKGLQTLRLSNVGDLKTIHNFKELKCLSLDSCPNLVIGFCSSQLPNNLKTLHIRSCDKLKTVFEKGTSSEVTLKNLQTLHLQGLPKLRSVGATLPALKDCVIVDCLNCEDGNVEMLKNRC